MNGKTWRFKVDFTKELITLQKTQMDAYYEGVRAGVKEYAYWKDGIEYVGTIGKTLKQAIEQIDRDRAERFERLSLEKD